MNPVGKLIIAGILVLAASLAHSREVDSLKVYQLLEDVYALGQTDRDSAFTIAKDAYGQALNLNNPYLQARSNYSIGYLFSASGNHALSLEYYFNALDFYERIPPETMRESIISQWIVLLSHIAISYFELEIVDKAHEYVHRSQKALQVADKYSPGAVSARNRMYILFNFGSLYIESGEYDKAQNVLSEVQQMNDSLHDNFVKANLLNNMGIIHKERGLFLLAKDSYEEALALLQEMNDQEGVARTYNNLGNLSLEQGEPLPAAGYFERALEAGRQANAWRSLRISTLALGGLYAEAGDHARAYEMVHIRSQLSDSIFSVERANQTASLSFQHEMATELYALEFRHDEQLIAESRTRNIFMFTGFLLLAFFLFAVLYAGAKHSKAKLAEKMHQLEVSQVRLKEQQLRNEMESQKKELTEKAMYVIQQNELLAGIAKRMQGLSREFPDQCGTSLDQMVAELKRGQDDKIWKEFEHRFRNVHDAFYKSLNKRFPDLTPGEKKLAAFLRLNLTTKDISAITQQGPDSIKVARSRLRKKLGLTQKENLVAFLENIEK